MIDEVRIFNESLTAGNMSSEYARISYSPSDCAGVLVGA